MSEKKMSQMEIIDSPVNEQDGNGGWHYVRPKGRKSQKKSETFQKPDLMDKRVDMCLTHHKIDFFSKDVKKILNEKVEAEYRDEIAKSDDEVEDLVFRAMDYLKDNTVIPWIQKQGLCRYHICGDNGCSRDLDCRFHGSHHESLRNVGTLKAYELINSGSIRKIQKCYDWANSGKCCKGIECPFSFTHKSKFSGKGSFYATLDEIIHLKRAPEDTSYDGDVQVNNDLAEIHPVIDKSITTPEKEDNYDGPLNLKASSFEEDMLSNTTITESGEEDSEGSCDEGDYEEEDEEDDVEEDLDEDEVEEDDEDDEEDDEDDDEVFILENTSSKNMPQRAPVEGYQMGPMPFFQPITSAGVTSKGKRLYYIMSMTSNGMQVCNMCCRNYVTVTEDYLKKNHPEMIPMVQSFGYAVGISMPRCWSCQTAYTHRSKNAPIKVDMETFQITSL